MNKIFSILIAITLSTLFTSCNKDNSKNATGFIEYTINGKTYTETDDINAAFIDGKFQGLTDGNLDAKIGDSQDITIKVGTSQNKIILFFKPDGIVFGSGSSTSNIVIFTKNESNLLEGTFEGKVYKDGDYTRGIIPITGKFSVKNFTRI